MIVRHWIDDYELCIDIGHTTTCLPGEPKDYHVLTNYVYHHRTGPYKVKLSRREVPTEVLAEFDKIAESTYWEYLEQLGD